MIYEWANEPISMTGKNLNIYAKTKGYSLQNIHDRKKLNQWFLSKNGLDKIGFMNLIEVKRFLDDL